MSTRSKKNKGKPKPKKAPEECPIQDHFPTEHLAKLCQRIVKANTGVETTRAYSMACKAWHVFPKPVNTSHIRLKELAK